MEQAFGASSYNSQDFDASNYWCGTSSGFGIRSIIDTSVNNDGESREDKNGPHHDSLDQIFGVGSRQSEENHSFNFSDFLNSENSRKDSCENFQKLGRNILGSETWSCSDVDSENRTQESGQVNLEDDSADYSAKENKLDKKTYWNFLGFKMTDFRDSCTIFNNEDSCSIYTQPNPNNEDSTPDGKLEKFCGVDKNYSIHI